MSNLSPQYIHMDKLKIYIANFRETGCIYDGSNKSKIEMPTSEFVMLLASIFFVGPVFTIDQKRHG